MKSILSKCLLLIIAICAAITSFMLMTMGRTWAEPVASGVKYEIGLNAHGAVTIYVSPLVTATQAERELTLPMIREALQTLTVNLTTTVPVSQMIVNLGQGEWLLNTNLTINGNLTLTLQSDEVKWLKLRSNAFRQTSELTSSSVAIANRFVVPASSSLAQVCPITPTTSANFDYNSFASVRAFNATLIISNTHITSWDTLSQTYDTDVGNGRAYVIARNAGRMDILNSDLSYLGSSDVESYGVSWRDDDDSAIRSTRVTGSIISSTFSYNYHGIYTYQATSMVFRGNKFHHNLGYGFDPHDLSHDFIIEDNESYENGDHGFIVSRGCHDFIFRRNKSYNNRYTLTDDDKNAQGFSIDPGALCSKYENLPSYNITLEDNQAWGNDGYGVRVISGYSNTFLNNTFTTNLKGISLEGLASTANTLRGNVIVSNTTDGVFVLANAHANLIENNIILNNGQHGVYFKGAANNRAISNTLAGNAQYGIRSSGFPTDTVENTWSSNAIYSNKLGGVSLPSTTNGGIKPPQVFIASAILITGTTVPGATVEIFSDEDNQAHFVEGVTQSDATGHFSFSKAVWQGKYITAITTDALGNSSALSKVPPRPRMFLPLLLRGQA